MTFGPLESICATSFVKSSVPSVQLVLVMVPALESMVVVPAALQFHAGDVGNFVAQAPGSTLTAGGTTRPMVSQPFVDLPSQSSIPAPHVVHALDEQVCPLLHEGAAQLAPQVASAFVDCSQPFDGEPSQSSVPAAQFAHAPAAHVCVFGVHGFEVPQAPLDEHVCVASPTHCVVVGTQTPVHAPVTHAEATQGNAAPHCPLLEHVSTPLFEHVLSPGLQLPVQPPLTQA